MSTCDKYFVQCSKCKGKVNNCLNEQNSSYLDKGRLKVREENLWSGMLPVRSPGLWDDSG